jgi:hypothetical protein
VRYGQGSKNSGQTRREGQFPRATLKNFCAGVTFFALRAYLSWQQWSYRRSTDNFE